MNINKIINNILILAAIAALTVSCKKEKLSPVPQTNLSDLVAFATPDRIEQQVNGIYAAMKSGNFLGGRGLVYNDVRGENWLNVTGNGVTALGVWNYSVVSTDNQVEGMWGAGYAAINRANVVLEGIDANAGVISAAKASAYKAEARFCRAVSYFYLTTLYGKKSYTADAGASLGIPLRLTAAKGSGGEALVRATQAQVFTQILDDLTFAENNLPAKYASGDSNVVRAHKNAAIAFKTRVYLHMGNYPAVITEANKIVPATGPFTAGTTGVNHSLNANFVNVFRTPYTSTESIFSLPMTVTNQPGTQNGLSSYHNSEFGLNPAGIIADANWKATDARKTLVTSSQRYQKYNDDVSNWVAIIRYSEVLLNLAEALARQSTAVVDVRALALVNAVRQRSDATTTHTPLTQADLVNIILNERNIELLGEGHRCIDLQRLVLAFPAKGSLAAVPPSAQNYVWPIPATELLYNGLAVQN
jgi:starch-binding outer membrane protein, SusD/RagB family